ncbi:MAG TPA: SCO family protein [Actinomycetes bacterium]|nr:SCO family protein [Actinomycetes bacterium]
MAGLVLAACAGHTAHGVPAPGASVGQQVDAALPSAVSGTVLVTSTGQHVDLASLAGKVLVVSDMMTLCQETCPLDTANIVAAAQAVERAGLGGKVQFGFLDDDGQRLSVSSCPLPSKADRGPSKLAHAGN